MSDEEAPPAKKAKQDPKGGKKGKDKKGKDKKGKKGKSSGGLSVSAHPRARAAVRRAKGFGGLVGFVLTAFIAHSAGLTAAQVLERALLVGIGGYLLAWACAVTVWRHLVLAEVRAALERSSGRFSAGQVSPARLDPSPADVVASPES